MGQHKHNETAKLAKEGKIPPNPPRMGKRERDRMLQMAITKAMFANMNVGFGGEKDNGR